MTRYNSTKAYRAAYVARLTRRRAYWLATLATTVSALAMLSGCEAPEATQTSDAAPVTEQMKVYKTLDACKAAEADDKRCETAFAEAWQWQGQQPGYTAKQQCEAEYGVGHCESRANPSGGNWFVPLMAGFMMSNAMNRLSPDPYARDRERERDGGGGGYPVYVNRQGYVSSYGGGGLRPMGYRVSSPSALPSSIEVERDPSGRGYAARGTSAKTQTGYRASSRGGFGKSSGFRGGCCG
jgi:uncharacterized protein YgiB involved in biofilm formation